MSSHFLTLFFLICPDSLFVLLPCTFIGIEFSLTICIRKEINIVFFFELVCLLSLFLIGSSALIMFSSLDSNCYLKQKLFLFYFIFMSQLLPSSLIMKFCIFSVNLVPVFIIKRNLKALLNHHRI